MEKLQNQDSGEREEINYLQNKLNDIVFAAKIKLKEILPNKTQGEEYDRKSNDHTSILKKITVISDLSDLSDSITLDQVYEQLKFLYESLEDYKTKSEKDTRDVVVFIQEQIMMRFSDLQKRKIKE